MVTLLFGTQHGNPVGGTMDVFPYGSNPFFQDDPAPIMVIPYSGTLQNWRFKTTSTGSYDLLITNISTGISITITIPVSGSVVSDDVQTLAVTAGDYILIHPADTGINKGSGFFTWSFKFISNNDNESFMACCPVGSFTGPAKYMYPACSNQLSTTESLRRFYCTTSGTINKFYVRYTEGAVGSINISFSIFKNGVIEASSTLSATTAGDASSHTVSVTDLNISFSIGDTISIQYDTGSHGSSSTILHAVVASIGYAPTNNNEQMIGGLMEAALNNNSGETEYGLLNGDIFDLNFDTGNTFNATESNRKLQHLNTDTIPIKNFTVNLQSAPGTGNSRVFRTRLNGANGGQVVTISDSNVTGSDLTHIDNMATDDLVNISHTAS